MKLVHSRRGLIAALAAGFTGLTITAAMAASGPSGAAAESVRSGLKPTATFTALRTQPSSLTFYDSRDRRRILVSGRRSDGEWIDLTDRAVLRPSAPIVRVESGELAPAAAGNTSIRVSAAGLVTTVPASVKSVSSPPISFVREVMPVLSKSGCNAGTCHGSARGKNGFKLSLRGYDPDYDFRALIDDISGRRFNRVNPAASLMLQKPTEGVPHQGGLVIEPDSRYYRLLYRWVVEGVHSDVNEAGRVNSIEVLPASIHLPLPGDHQRMLVIAHYPDGTTRDVTSEAVFSSSMADTASVSPDGLVKGVRRGEAAILVRYEGNYGVGQVLVMGDRTGFAWHQPPAYNYIDTLVYQKLKRVKIQPGDLCTDAQFLRRVSLDVTGLPPAPDQIRAFLADPAPSQVKRSKAIDRLLASPEYVDHWANKWADLLDVSQKYLGDKGVAKFYGWIRQSVQANKPYDKFVRELVTASGSSYDNPAAGFYRINRDSAHATETVTQLFLGTRFSCNKCHDHPFERWTQRQYYQFGAFFARVDFKPGKNPDEEMVVDNPAGTVIYPRDNRPALASFPFGPIPAAKVDANPRVRLADWMTSNRNPLFARAMANRLWSYFFGRGIIEPVDDIRSGNPPSNPELLDALTADFVAHGYDLKYLMRVICESRVYQLSFETNRFNEDDTSNFSHAAPRRLTAEQLLDSIDQATGARSKLPGLPDNGHADQMPDSKVGDGGGFLALFGSPPRESPCECERSSQVSLGQALNLVNGPTISDALLDPKGRLVTLLTTVKDDRKLVEEIYLAAVCRLPSDREMRRSLDYMKTSHTRADGAQDLMWGLLTGPEFLFNH